MDKCRQYDKKDYESVCDWMNSRGLDPIPESVLPEVGSIVEGIACGFLYQTDSKMAIIEHYITNPFADKAMRRQSMQLVTAHLLKQARDLGFKYIIAASDHKSICKLAKDNGFKLVGIQHAFLKELYE